MSNFYDVCVICVQDTYTINKPETEQEMRILIEDVVNELCGVKLFAKYKEHAPVIIKRLKSIYCYNWKKGMKIA